MSVSHLDQTWNCNTLMLHSDWITVGGSCVDYYSVEIIHPTTPGVDEVFTAEAACNTA